MNLKQFQVESKRTMPFGGEPSNEVEFENMLGNYAMGLVGEWFELQTVLSEAHEDNIAELKGEVEKESGDILHYAVGLLSLLGEEVVNFNELVERVTFAQTEESLGNILEIPKKHIYHRHELKSEELKSAVYVVINKVIEPFGTSLSDVLQTNIDKLKTRYPEKFSTADSIARVDTK